ncbi:MAG: Hpt domain-containing protein [Candidatus Omnitrophota bacterium]
MDMKVIDMKEALDRVQDDRELLFELFDIFQDDFKVKRKEIQKALDQGDCETVRNLAHSLKGAAGNISAKRLQALFLFVEEKSAAGTLSEIGGRLTELDREFEEYKVEAQKLRSERGLL